MGHQGTYATGRMLQQHFWWPEIEEDAILVCQIVSLMPNKTEDSTRDVTCGDLHPIDLSSIARGHGSYDPSVKWLQIHS